MPKITMWQAFWLYAGAGGILAALVALYLDTNSWSKFPTTPSDEPGPRVFSGCLPAAALLPLLAFVALGGGWETLQLAWLPGALILEHLLLIRAARHHERRRREIVAARLET